MKIIAINRFLFEGNFVNSGTVINVPENIGKTYVKDGIAKIIQENMIKVDSIEEKKEIEATQNKAIQSVQNKELKGTKTK